MTEIHDDTTGKPAGHSRAKGWWETFKTSAVHAVVAHVLLVSAAAGTTIWSIVEELPLVVWVIAIITILLLYFVLLDLQYYFQGDIRIERAVRIHAVLLTLIIIAVTAPLAMVQTIENAHIATLQAQHRADIAESVTKLHQAEHKLEETREAQQGLDDKRYALYTALFRRVLIPSSIEPTDLKDLMSDCITSITITNNKAVASDLGNAVFYRVGKDLHIPPSGYAGYLHKDIEKLVPYVGEQGNEPWSAYCQRVGVAGWCYRTGQEVDDPDVQHTSHGYCYLPAQTDVREPPDHAMFCAPILDPRDAQQKRRIGVLCISSLNPKIVFNERDKATARFFAMLLGKYQPASSVAETQ